MTFISAVGTMKGTVGKTSLTVGPGATRGKETGSTDDNKSIDEGIFLTW